LSLRRWGFRLTTSAIYNLRMEAAAATLIVGGVYRRMDPHDAR
jgi:hypothetical protein